MSVGVLVLIAVGVAFVVRLAWTLSRPKRRARR
jgi:uncharacterized membrane protein